MEKKIAEVIDDLYFEYLHTSQNASDAFLGGYATGALMGSLKLLQALELISQKELHELAQRKKALDKDPSR
jgi:hypothetical protein